METKEITYAQKAIRELIVEKKEWEEKFQDYSDYSDENYSDYADNDGYGDSSGSWI